MLHWPLQGGQHMVPILRILAMVGYGRRHADAGRSNAVAEAFPEQTRTLL